MTAISFDMAELSDDEIEALVETGLGDHLWGGGVRLAEAARNERDLRLGAALLRVAGPEASLAGFRATFTADDRALVRMLAAAFAAGCSYRRATPDLGRERTDRPASDGLAKTFGGPSGDFRTDVFEGADEIAVADDADRPNDSRGSGVAALSRVHGEHGHGQRLGDGDGVSGDVRSSGEAAFEERNCHDSS